MAGPDRKTLRALIWPAGCSPPLAWTHSFSPGKPEPSLTPPHPATPLPAPCSKTLWPSALPPPATASPIISRDFPHPGSSCASARAPKGTAPTLQEGSPGSLHREGPALRNPSLPRSVLPDLSPTTHVCALSSSCLSVLQPFWSFPGVCSPPGFPSHHGTQPKPPWPPGSGSSYP